MRNLIFLFSLMMWLAWVGTPASAQERYAVSGKITDTRSKDPVLYANVVIRELSLGTSSNEKGEYRIRGIPAGTFTLIVSYIGYEEFSQKITVTGDFTLNIQLSEQSLGLDEVIVTAENSKSGATSSRIKSEAISHVQASSLKDVLQLIPGNLATNPNLRDPGKMSIREVGTSVNSALGTAIIVDGIPLSNDGNLQQSISTTNYMSSVAGTGVDIRGIAVNNIESITVDVGIPSAEHGNLTSGAVHIKTKAGGSPLTVKLKADPRTKQGYLSKGFLLPKNGGVLNADFDYTRSFGHIIKHTSLYNRISGTAKYSQTFFREQKPLNLEAKVSYGSTLDGEKWDPDMLLQEENYSHDQNMLAALSLSWSLNKPWISNLSFDAGYSREWQKGFEKTFTGSSSGATFFSTATTSGEYQIAYAPSSYYAEVTYDGRPYNLYLKLKASAYRKTGIVTNNLLAGIEWKSTGNNGQGRQFNPDRPPATLGTRPRPFTDIPGLDQLSFFAEDKINLEIGSTQLDLMAGIRMDNIEPAGLFATNGSLSFDPRINIRYQLIHSGNNRIFRDLSLRFGYGRTSKSPTLVHLYPDQDYNDVVGFNYYPELIVATTTVISDTRNYNLKPAQSNKKEAGIDLQIGKIQARLTAFAEKHEQGFVNDYVLFPQFYRDYDVLPAGYKPWYVPGDGIYYTDKTTGIPVRLGYDDDVKFAGYSTFRNGDVRIKKGLEYSIDFGKIQTLRTSVNISGAYFHTESYLLDVPYYERIDYTVFEGGVSKQRPFVVRYTDQYGYGTLDKRLNTNIGLITHIPELKMLLSLTTQVIWFEKNKRKLYPWKTKLYTLSELRDFLQIPDLFKNEKEGDLYYQLPVGYIIAGEPEKEYSLDDFIEPMAQMGIKKQITTYFPLRTLPSLIMCNMKVSKDIGRRYRLSFFANNFLNIRPWHLDQRSGRYMRRNERPFFGADLTMEL